MSKTDQGGTWGEAALAGLPHVLFALAAGITPITRYLRMGQINQHAVMLVFAGVVLAMLIFAWRRSWPRWAASWIGYGLIMAWITPFGLDGGYTVTGWLSSLMPAILANVLDFAQILLPLGIALLLARRDLLSGLLMAMVAVPVGWAWVDSDAIHSAIGLPLFVFAGLVSALVAAAVVRMAHLEAGIRLALLANLLTRLPLTYARLYHHDFLLTPTPLEAVAILLRDVLIGAILITGPLWGWTLVEQGWQAARGVRRGERSLSDHRHRLVASTLRRALRFAVLAGAILAATVVLVMGARPCGWLDVALNVSGCQRTLERHDSPVHSVAFSPDGETLASSSADGSARLWSVTNRELLHTMGMPTGGDVGYSHDIAFSPDSTTLAYGLTDGTVRLWRVSDGTPLDTLHVDGERFFCLAFSPDGRSLAAGSRDGTIHLWRLSDGTALPALTGPQDGVLDLAYSPDGSMLASGAFDGTVLIWRAAEGTILHTFGPGEAVAEGVAFSPDGSVLAIASWDGSVQLWSVGDWRRLRVMQSTSSGINDVAFSPDGTMLATGDSWHRIQWWRVADGALLRDVGGHDNTVESVAFSPDGEVLASGSLDGRVRLWQMPKRTSSR